jgi:DNA-binding NtrC family response regulator
MAKVLLLDDEMTMVQMVGELLRAEGHQVLPFTNGVSAADKLSSISPELVIATLGSERARGHVWDVLQKARSLTPPALVIVLTAAVSMDAASEAMRKGAYDCLHKPFTLDDLRLRVQRALSYQTALAENFSLRKQLQPETRFQHVITRSPRMQAILSLIERVADSDYPLLIQGPPGSGKQLLARTIHLNSRRRLAPFIPVRCATFPDDALEAELFGQRKPSFSSDPEGNLGIFRTAEGGTVFLNEVGSLSLPLQAQLLEVLEKRQIQTLGQSAPIRLHVRVLAGSDGPLESRLATGAFARDLYQRLNATPIVLPPLKERPEDIPLLVSHFLEGRIDARNGQPYAITPEALEICCAHGWPGNITELESSIRHACLVCQANTIQASDLPRSIRQPIPAVALQRPSAGRNGHRELPPSSIDLDRASVNPWTDRRESDLVPLKQFLRDQELNYLHKTLAQVDGSKERAAELLGISLATIYRKLSEPDADAEAL